MSPWKAFGPVPDKQETIDKATTVIFVAIVIVIYILISTSDFQCGKTSKEVTKLLMQWQIQEYFTLYSLI